MIYIITFVCLLILVGIAIFFISQSMKAHSEVCSAEHMMEIADITSQMKKELVEKVLAHSSFDNLALKTLEQDHRVVIRYSEQKFVLTYLTAAPTDEGLIHSFSMSWTNRKLPIKSASYLASAIVHALQLEDIWDKELRMSLKKTQVFHFIIKLNAEQNDEYITKPVLIGDELFQKEESIQKISLDVHVERKYD